MESSGSDVLKLQYLKFKYVIKTNRIANKVEVS